MRPRELVSVCIPSYNHARFLPDAIESVLAQTYRPFEIVIVDDGSTDGSLDVALQYSREQPDLIRVFRHSDGGHRGISATANLGFEKARGRYWTGLPSDDEFDERKLELEVAYLQSRPDCGFVYSHAQHMTLDGQKLPRRWGSDLTTAPDPLVSLILKNSIPAMTVMARRRVMAEVGPHAEGLVFSDWELWIRMLAHTSCGFIPRILARQRIHTSNTSVGLQRGKQLVHDLEVLEHLSSLASNDLSHSRLGERRIRALLKLRCAEHEYLLGTATKARESLDQAFGVDPSIGRDLRFLARWLGPRQEQGVEAMGSSQLLGAWCVEQLPLRAKRKRQLARYLTGARLRRISGDRTMNAFSRAAYAVGGVLVDPGHVVRKLVSLPQHSKPYSGRLAISSNTKT